MSKLKWATDGPGDIESAIKKRHTFYDWQTKTDNVRGFLFFEMRTGTGFKHGEPSSIDALHLEDTPGRGFLRTAYEIKRTRADFRSEIRKPNKRRAALRISNRFYFVTPQGMVGRAEIPIDCGLLELQHSPGDVRSERLVEVVPAPYRDGMSPTWGLVAALCRRFKKGGS